MEHDTYPPTSRRGGRRPSGGIETRDTVRRLTPLHQRPLSEWPNGDLFMIERELILRQRWIQPDGSLGYPTETQLEGLMVEAPNYCVWFLALVASIREEMAHLFESDPPADQSEAVMVPDFFSWQDGEIENLHDQVQGWYPPSRRPSEDRLFPVYRLWSRVLLDALREELVGRGLDRGGAQ